MQMSEIDKTTERLCRKAREIRKANRYTLAEIAEKAGMHHPIVSRIESGRVSPTIGSLSRILEPMGYTLDIVPIVQGEMNPALNSLARALEGLGYKIVPVENTEGNGG